MQNEYVSPDLEIKRLSLAVDILELSKPENKIPEEGGDLPRDDLGGGLF